MVVFSSPLPLLVGALSAQDTFPPVSGSLNPNACTFFTEAITALCVFNFLVRILICSIATFLDVSSLLLGFFFFLLLFSFHIFV